MTRLIITVDRGMITGVISDRPVEYVIIDYDVNVVEDDKRYYEHDFKDADGIVRYYEHDFAGIDQGFVQSHKKLFSEGL